MKRDSDERRKDQMSPVAEEVWSPERCDDELAELRARLAQATEAMDLEVRARLMWCLGAVPGRGSAHACLCAAAHV